MGVQQFLQQSGFKVLAMARLSSCEYSITLYLLNCAISGLDQLITTEAELALLTGYTDNEIDRAMANLVTRNIVRVHYGDPTQTPRAKSMMVGIQFDMEKWSLDFADKATHDDAIVFPFRRLGHKNFQVVEGTRHDKNERTNHKGETATWQRVTEAFARGRVLSDGEIKKAEQAAKTLVETHPVDQVIVMILHFGMKIPTLSLLASSWQHYSELFEEEHQKVDLSDARQKHSEMDQTVQEAATKVLENREELELSEDEITVLQILAKHRHPRRQLFWAYQVRTRYPKLASFFEETAPLMLAVTTSGSVVKRTLE